ncbi:hypothetical protein HELRODRAFT_184843 [Helobdella robusta]|uniref:procollagen-proline 4-dioxygenase n=1 Tax=Helobdella robusta TaxID=6412 RepID=T1FM27_HELRO|nr:hypothetical protein HELRODRAFT_184843 [Helobdella robusta]ESO12774.1 hypothetical protein HELRODRAFT_184843 [Helobdella robusta]
MFTALVELTKALRAENSVAKELKSYIGKELLRIQKLESIARDLENHSEQALNDPMKYLANPVNAYLLVKRFAVDWTNVVEQYIKPHISHEFLSSLSSQTSWFPDSEDLSGSALALLRLQDVYALQTSEIAKGKIEGVVKSPDMNADDCFQLGLVAYNREDFYHAVLWMDESLKRDQNETFKTTDRSKTLDYLSYAMYRQGNVHHAYNLTKEWLTMDPNNERAKSNLNHYIRMIGEISPNAEMKNIRSLPEHKYTADYNNYEKLCRGEKTHVYPHEKDLTCQYKRHKPMFYLAPLKEELMYFDPPIAIYHDAISEKEMQKVKDLAMPMLHRSGVFQLSDTQSEEFPEYRTSKTAWLSDHSDSLIARIARRASGMSNLTLDTVEFLQVLNYGIGGQYEPHYDFARPNEESTFEEWRGNRVATVIFYISDVEAGGATVFNELGVRLTPKKRACAIWYNLLKNGEGDYRTRHAGCPVLSGTKWVCNKWFHIKGQEFSRQCSLSPLE